MNRNRKNMRKANNDFRSKRSNRPDQDGQKLPLATMVTIPKSINLIFPDKMTAKLSYTVSGLLQILTTNGYIATYLTPSAAYDVDPTILSTAMPGFSELATFYSIYRVIASAVTVEAVIPSTDGIPGNSAVMVIVPLNSSPAGASYADVIGWRGNTYSKSCLLPITAQPTKLSSSMTTEKIFGSRAVYFDDSFTSNVTTIPVNNWYWAFGFASDSNPPLANLDISVYIRLTVDIEFFSRKKLNA